MMDDDGGENIEVLQDHKIMNKLTIVQKKVIFVIYIKFQNAVL